MLGRTEANKKVGVGVGVGVGSGGKREVFRLMKLSDATINTVSDRLMKCEYDTLKEFYSQKEIQVVGQKPAP